MSDNSASITPSTAPRWPIAWAIGLGLLLLLLAVIIAPVGVITGLLVFNGCFGASSTFKEILGTLWIFGLWPLSVLATALVPPVLLGKGRGGKAALVAFGIGCLVSLFIWIAWLAVGYFAFC
jgi:hypothetical protein